MERNYESINEENYIIEFELFGFKLIFGRRTKKDNDRIIDLNINTEFLSDLFNKFKNWLNSLFENPKKDENENK